jgi:trimeric autotransporter adhesin
VWALAGIFSATILLAPLVDVIEDASARGLFTMSSAKRKLQLLAAFTICLTLALAVGCKGFFVNQPTSLTVNPSTVSLAQGGTQQLLAQASFENGGTLKDVTTSSVWGSSNSCAVSVVTTGSSAGKVTAVGTGGAVTITATFNGVSGTATVTVATGITIGPCGTFTRGSSQQFTATLSGMDVTSSATWTSSNSAVVNFASSSSSVATFPGTGTATITATTSSATGTLQITVQ